MSLYVFVCLYVSLCVFMCPSAPPPPSLPYTLCRNSSHSQKVCQLAHLFSFCLFIFCCAPISAVCVCVVKFSLFGYFLFFHFCFVVHRLLRCASALVNTRRCCAPIIAVCVCVDEVSLSDYFHFIHFFFAVHRLLRCASALVNTRRGKCPPPPN
jgi:hypothetical protein